MNRPITMQEIADMAGVSIATVSRVIKKNPLVAKETRQKVQGLIDQYNYVPNAMASSLVTQKSNMLGMIVPDITNPYFATMYTHAEHLATEHDYSLLMMSTSRSESVIASINRLLNRQVDGLFVISASIDQNPRDEELARCLLDASSRVPLILNNEVLPDLELNFLSADNRNGTRKAMEYLIALGHQKIAFIGGPDNLNSVRHRREVYLETLREHDIKPNPAFIQFGAGDAMDGAVKFEHILASGDIPTAVITNNETISMGVLQSCNEHRFRIPDDISVVSCDNTFISRSLFPKLTSIDIFPDRQGETGVQLLLKMIAGEEVPKMTTTPCELVIRNSTARPPQVAIR